MGSYVIQREGGRLVVERSRGEALSSFLLTFGWLSLLSAVPFIVIFRYHYLIVANLVMAGIVYLLGLPLLYNSFTYVKKKTFLFDRSSDRLLLNGKIVCCLSEVLSVIFDSDRISTGRIPIERRELYLKTKSGTKIQIELSSASGANYHELKEIGRTIAEFIGVDTNVPRDDEPEPE